MKKISIVNQIEGIARTLHGRHDYTPVMLDEILEGKHKIEQLLALEKELSAAEGNSDEG